MNRRRLLVLVSLAVAPMLAIAGACSFPEVTFGPTVEAGAGDGEGGPVGDAPIGDSPVPVGDNEDVDPTGVQKDASTIPEGGGGIDASSVEAGCCDCDLDGFKTEAGSCAKTAGDCDDFNEFLTPGRQDFVAESMWPSDHQPIYDWDCNGTVTKQYNYNVSCNTFLAGCAQQGFTTDVPCGVKGTYVTCKAAVVPGTCELATSDQRIQGCK